MKFHIIQNCGTRLLNQSHDCDQVPFDGLAYKECAATLVVRAGTAKATILSALREIEEYVKKDL